MRNTEENRDSHELPVMVIGAGPAGLAAAAVLKRSGIAAIVIDRARAVGASWRGRYDRLRLNSPRWFSELPDGPFKPGTPVFPSRDAMVDYLADYAQRFGLQVRLGVTVERLERDTGGWRLRTSAGPMLARDVIVAIGHEGQPFLPDWPGRNEFRGTLIHSAQYRSADPFRGRDVLVVGPGCSGGEIAYDLLDGGAGRVRLAVRTPPNIMLRIPLGAQIASALMRVPTSWADGMMRFVQRRTVGDLTEFGLPMADEGVFSRLRRLHATPMIVDREVIDAIRRRDIEIVGAVESFDESGVRIGHGTRIEPEVVIAATGYRPGLEPLVGHLDVLDEHGFPRIVVGEALTGLRFHGFDTRPGQIRQFGLEARRTAMEISRRRPSEPIVVAAADSDVPTRG